MPATKKTPTKKASRGDARPLAKLSQRRGAFKGPEAPPLDVLIKLGSLAVHVEELVEVVGGFERFEAAIDSLTHIRFKNAVTADVAAIRTLVEDGQLREWFAAMGALLPVKRSKR